MVQFVYIGTIGYIGPLGGLQGDSVIRGTVEEEQEVVDVKRLLIVIYTNLQSAVPSNGTIGYIGSIRYP